MRGAYYYFQHASGQHTLVIADDIVAGHEPLPGAAVIPFYPPEKSAVADRENIHAWTLGEEIKPGRYYNDDYDFKKPRSDLSNMRQQPRAMRTMPTRSTNGRAATCSTATASSTPACACRKA